MTASSVYSGNAYFPIHFRFFDVYSTQCYQFRLSASDSVAGCKCDQIADDLIDCPPGLNISNYCSHVVNLYSIIQDLKPDRRTAFF